MPVVFYHSVIQDVGFFLFVNQILDIDWAELISIFTIQDSGFKQFYYY